MRNFENLYGVSSEEDGDGGTQTSQASAYDDDL
jgi:hypothetical protein